MCSRVRQGTSLELFYYFLSHFICSKSFSLSHIPIYSLFTRKIAVEFFVHSCNQNVVYKEQNKIACYFCQSNLVVVSVQSNPILSCSWDLEWGSLISINPGPGRCLTLFLPHFCLLWSVQKNVWLLDYTVLLC